MLRLFRKIRIIARLMTILLTDYAFLTSFAGNFFYLLYLRTNRLRSGRKYVLVSLTEHIGDLVAVEPISRYLRTKFPAHIIYWIVDKKYCRLFEYNKNIDKILQVSCFSEWIFLRHIATRHNRYDLHIDGKVCDKYQLLIRKPNPHDITLENYLMKGNLLFCFSRAGNLEIDPCIAPCVYLPPQSAGSPFTDGYIVLHTGANTADKLWNVEGWNELANFILNQYRQLLIVEIGFNNAISSSNPRYKNYCGQKDLLDIGRLIKESRLFIGVESGFAHVANALEKEALVFIGPKSNFRRYMPYSGKFLREKERHILYFDKPLSEMPFEFVKETLIYKLTLVN